MSKNYASFPAIWDLVREIPKGQVASYGMVASLLAGVTPRIVGFAMSATPAGEGIPWHRVINSAGKISERDGATRQRDRLLDEGISFKTNGAVDWLVHRWQGPSENWLAEAGIDFMDFLTIQSNWPG
ncbi:MAG: MGMT family protein [Alphaproteobacteria bacterium]|nr:MGMT family protein [Alphaproteobacteria bacterium]